MHCTWQCVRHNRHIKFLYASVDSHASCKPAKLIRIHGVHRRFGGWRIWQRGTWKSIFVSTISNRISYSTHTYTLHDDAVVVVDLSPHHLRNESRLNDVVRITFAQVFRGEIIHGMGKCLYTRDGFELEGARVSPTKQTRAYIYIYRSFVTRFQFENSPYVDFLFLLIRKIVDANRL